MDLREKTKNPYRHPWELSRSHNILKLLPKNSGFAYADIGSGDGYFCRKLMEMTNGNVFAVDKGYTNTRKKKDGLICLNDTALLKTDSIDCLIMMDVLEHIENENAFLQQVLETLTPGGKIIITVPAFQFVFSSHDLFLKHYRRYNRKIWLACYGKTESSLNRRIISTALYFYSGGFLSCSKKPGGLRTKTQVLGCGHMPKTVL